MRGNGWRYAKITPAPSQPWDRQVRRWARGPKAQAPVVGRGSNMPQRAIKGSFVWKRELRGVDAKFGCGRHPSEQHRNAAAVDGAFHIDCGVADKPYLRTGGDPRLRQGKMHRFAAGLVRRRIAGADHRPEQRRPAEPLDLQPQQWPGLVADDAEVDAVLVQAPEQRIAAGERRQSVE